MSLFSGNRKVRSRRPKTALEAARREISPRAKSRQLEKHARELHGEIERLECYIAAIPHLSRQQRLNNVNMVPPMDLPSPASRRNRRVPIAKQRVRRSQNLRLILEGIITLGVIAAGIGWLNQAFHFWN